MNKRILIWSLISAIMSISLLSLVFWPSSEDVAADDSNVPVQTMASEEAKADPVVPVAPIEPEIMGSSIPILMYHHIKEPKDPAGDRIDYNLSVPTPMFAEQMAALSAQGYTSIPLRELFAKEQSKKVVLTFDDGYKDVITNAYPIMQSHGFKGTVFVIFNSVGRDDYMTLDDLKTLKDAGWEIGSHTLSHPDLSKASPEKAVKEISESKAALESQLGVVIDTFCYPSGRYSQEVIDAVQLSGYKLAVTTKPGSPNTRIEALALKRVRINGPDSLKQFTGKVLAK